MPSIKKRKKLGYRKNELTIITLIMFLMMGVGFSILSTSLIASGVINLKEFTKPTAGIAVREVAYVASTNSESFDVLELNDNSIKFHTELANAGYSYITVAITIKNYTNNKLVFDEIVYDRTNTSNYSNLNIVPTTTLTPNSSILEKNSDAGDEITFNVTFAYFDSSNIPNQELDGTISFHFTPMVNITYTGLTNSGGLSSEYIRSASYTTADNTIYKPTINITGYSGNYSIKNTDQTVTLTENTDYTNTSGVITFLNTLTEDLVVNAEAPTGENPSDFFDNIIDGLTPDSNGIITGTPGDSCTNTFAYDGTADNNLRFVGPNPCNYVKFNCDDYGQNCETWRMIGIMNDVSDEPTIKMVKSTLDYSGTQWNNTASNNWLTSTLYTTLNTTYYNSLNTANGKDLILETEWNIGGIESTWTSANFYAKAHETKSETKFKVGLFEPDDYGFATSGGATARATCIGAQLNGSSYTSNCRNANWLYNNSSYQWTLIRRPSSANNQVYYITTAGLSAYTTVTYGTSNYNYRPCVYLDPSVMITDGDGSVNNPYVLAK